MLAKETGVKIAERPDEQLIGAPPGYHQKTLIAQFADAVFHDFPVGLYAIAGVTALILVLAANTAFNGFPVLGSILAQDSYLPAPVAHARRPAGVLQRHPVPGLRRDRLRRRVPRRGDRPDPAVHRRGVRVVHPEPDRHGSALDPPAARRDRRRRAPKHAAGTRHQHHRVPVHGDGSAGRRRHEIRCGGVDCDPRDGRHVRDHEDDPQALRGRLPRTRESGRRTGRHRAAQPQPRDRPGVEPAPADAARPGVRQGHPARRAGGDPRQRRRQGGPRAAEQVGGQRGRHTCRSR